VRQEGSADNTRARSKPAAIESERYEEKSKAYLQEIRRGAMIEYPK
jgi:hypothetical protein